MTKVARGGYAESIRLADKAAAEAGLEGRVRFEVAPAASFPGTGYGLVTTFDCLHDMGDPVAAARHVRDALAPEGTWMLVEPYAEDDVADNLNPVRRVYYGFSTLLCVPHALSEGVRLRRCRRCAGQPGRGAGHTPRRHRSRFHAVPPRRADPVQPRLRGAAVNAHLVDVAWLAAHLDSVLVVDCRFSGDRGASLAAYRAGHLPGAVHSYWLDLCGEDTSVMTLLPDRDRAAAALSRLVGWCGGVTSSLSGRSRRSTTGGPTARPRAAPW